MKDQPARFELSNLLEYLVHWYSQKAQITFLLESTHFFQDELPNPVAERRAQFSSERVLLARISSLFHNKTLRPSFPIFSRQGEALCHLVFWLQIFEKLLLLSKILSIILDQNEISGGRGGIFVAYDAKAIFKGSPMLNRYLFLIFAVNLISKGVFASPQFSEVARYPEDGHIMWMDWSEASDYCCQLNGPNVDCDNQDLETKEKMKVHLPSPKEFLDYAETRGATGILKNPPEIPTDYWEDPTPVEGYEYFSSGRFYYSTEGYKAPKIPPDFQVWDNSDQVLMFKFWTTAFDGDGFAWYFNGKNGELEPNNYKSVDIAVQCVIGE